MKKEAWLRWLLLGGYGYHPIAHFFLIHALCINDRMQQEKACSFWFPLIDFVHHLTSPMSMCFVLGKAWHDALMMCIDDVSLYWVDVTFHMSISMFLLHDAHEEERKKKGLLLLCFLLGDFGLSILHGGDGGWKKRALLWWLLLGEYGMKSFSTHISPFLLLLHNFGMRETRPTGLRMRAC